MLNMGWESGCDIPIPSLFTIKSGLNVIHNAERRMIGPAQVVGRSLIDHESAGRFRQFRCCELIVDPPADIVVECTTALAPPCVRSLDVSGEITHHIHKLQFSQPFVDICALLGEESGMRFVGFGVFDVERRVRC